ncbi:IS91 family transposase [Desulfothermus naphthae]
MIYLSSIITQFKDSFFVKYKNFVLPEHKKALHVMEHCRDKHGPLMLARCSNDNCSHTVYIPHSCGHRSCPHCQNHENQQWIENQLSKKLPATYWLITFTLPTQLRNLAWKNQKTFYSLMFASVQETLKTFVKNDKKLGGAAGFIAVLHTHSRNLNYHPHIHVIMPAASINTKTGLWRTKSTKYLFNQKALGTVFRAKLLHAIVDAKLRLPKNCSKKWIVHCKNVGNAEKAIVYLGNYLYRGVIREKDILKCKNGKVTFRYFHAKTRQYKTRTVSGEYFLYLIMLHVLPKGFRRSRSYGFLHSCSKKLICFLQLILRINPFTKWKRKPKPSIVCPLCGNSMKIIKTMIPGLLPSQAGYCT